jgi:hypothetical protein
MSAPDPFGEHAHLRRPSSSTLTIVRVQLTTDVLHSLPLLLKINILVLLRVLPLHLVFTLVDFHKESRENPVFPPNSLSNSQGTLRHCAWHAGLQDGFCSLLVTSVTT